MNIALHISEDTFETWGINFNVQIALTLASSHKENRYFLLLDHPQELNELPENCTKILVGPAIKNRLSLYYWYQFKLPSVLKKIHADIFIPHHNCFSKKLKPKQFYTIQQTDKNKSFLRQQHKDLQLANGIFQLLKSDKIPSKYIDKTYEVSYGFAPIFRGYSFTEKEHIKKEYSDENDYFFAVVPTGEETLIKTLLKAFSHFKKWQKSSLKLIILTDVLGISDFHLYKFREDVEIKYRQQTSLDVKAALMACSYCNIMMEQKDIIASVRCLTPSIFISDKEHVFDDAALYATADEKSLSKQMILVYKDEYLRNQIIRECESTALLYTWENAAEIVYNAISSIQ